MWVSESSWISIFIVYIHVPIVVRTLSQCIKENDCKCSTDEGTIDLSKLSLPSSSAPRYGNRCNCYP